MSSANEVNQIIDELRRAHEGEPWHGPSTQDVLNGISPANAIARPIAGAHTIWELVLHLTSWTREVTRRLGGARPADPVEGDWPTTPTDPTNEAWRGACLALSAAHETLIADLARFPHVRLHDLVGEQRDRELGSGVSHAVMLHGLAQHAAYHSGQMVLLRRALGR